MPINIRQYSMFDDRLRIDWENLWDELPNAHFFNHPNWLLSCLKVYPTHQYRIFAAYDGSQLAAIVPLVLERKFGLRAAVFPGGRHLAKAALLAKTPTYFLALTDYFAQKESFVLSELDEEAANMTAALSRQFMVQEASINPYVPLTGDPFSFLSAKQRSKIFNKVKTNQGHLAYVCFKGKEQGLKLAFDLERRSSRRGEGKPVFVGEDQKFFLQLLAEYGRGVVVDILHYDNVPMVFSVGFEYKKTYLACCTAFNDTYKHLSPRKLLVYHMYERLQREGFEVLDFSRGQSSLKQELTPLSYKQYDVSFAAGGLAGAWWNFGQQARRALLHSKRLYGSYLAGKGFVIKLHDRFKSV